MSRMIRTRFSSGSANLNDEGSRVSPTSVVDFEAPSTRKDRSNNNDATFNQLKRQMTTLEHEKASLEQELLNQINTVVFDKEAMVETLQEKLMESERRFKEERKAHLETRTSYRQQKFASCGEAKFEIFRLQDQVQELQEKMESQETELQSLRSKKGRDNEAFQSQITFMETESKSQLEALKMEHSQQLEKLQEAQAAMIADLETNHLQEHQQKIQEMEQKLQSEKDRTRGMEQSLEGVQQAQAAIVADVEQQSQQDVKKIEEQLQREAEKASALEHSLKTMEQAHASSIEDLEKKHQQNIEELERKCLAEEARATALEGNLQEMQQSRDVFARETEQEFLQQNQKQVKDLEETLKQIERNHTADVAMGQQLLQESQEKLQQAEQELKREISKVQELQDEVQAIDQSQSGRMADIERQSQQRMTELEQKYNMEAERASSLEESLIEMQRAQNAMISDLEQYHQQEIQELEQKFQREAAKASSFEERLQQMEATQSSVIAELEQGVFQEHQQRIEEMEQRLEKEKEKSATLEQLLEKTEEAHSSEMAELQRNLSWTEVQADRTRSFEEEVAALRESLCLSESEKESLCEALEELKSNAAELRVSLDERLQEHADQTLQLERECHEREQEASALKIQLEQAAMANHLLREDLEEAQSSMNTTKQKDSVFISNLEEQCTRRNREIDLLKGQLEQEKSTTTLLKQNLDSNSIKKGSLEEIVCQLEARCTRQTDKIHSIERQLEQEKICHTALQSSHETLKQSYSELSTVEKHNADSLATLKAENDAQLAELNSLRRQHEETADANKSMKSSLAKHEATIEILQEEADKLQSHKEIFCHQLASSESRNEELLKEFEIQKAKAASTQIALEDATKNITELESTLGTKEDTIFELQDQIGYLQDQIVQEQTTISSLMASLDEEEIAKSSLNEKRAYTEEQITDLETQLQAERDNVETLKAAVAREAGINTDLLAAQERSQVDFDQLQEENGKLMDRIDEMEVQLCGQQENIQALQTSLKLKEKELEVSEQELLSFENEYSSQNTEVERLRDQIRKEQDTNADLENSLDDQKSSTGNSFAEFERDRVALLDRIGKLRDELDQSRSTNATLQESLTSLERAHRQKDESLASHEKDNSILRDKARQFRSQAQKLYCLVNILKASLEGSQRANRGLETEQGQLEERLQLKSHELEGALASNAQLKTELGESRATQAQTSEENKHLQDQNGILQFKVSSLDNQMKKETSQSANLEEAVAELRSANVVLEAAVDSRDKSISEFESANAELSEKLKCLQDELDSNRRCDVTTSINGPNHGLNEGSKNTAHIEERGASSDSVPLDIFTSPSDEEDTQDPEKVFDAYYLKTTVETLQEENTELKVVLEEYKRAQSLIAELGNEKDLLLGEIKDLQIQLGQKPTGSPESKSSLEEQQMESIVKATLDERTTQDDAIAELHNERDTLVSEVYGLQSQLKEARIKNELLSISLHRHKRGNARDGQESSSSADSEGKQEGALTQGEESPDTPTKPESNIDVEQLQQEICQLREQLKSLQPSQSDSGQDPPTESVGTSDNNDELIQTKEVGKEEAKEQLTRNEVTHLRTDLGKELPSEEDREADCIAQRDRIRSLEDQLSKADTSIKFLEEKLSNIRANADEKARRVTDKMETNIKTVQKELESTKGWLEKSLDEVEGLRIQVSNSATLLQTEEQKNQGLRTQIEQLETELFNTKQSLAINLEEVERLHDSLGTNEEESEKVRKLLESFKSAAEHWRNEAAQLKAAKEEREAKLKVAYTREVGEYKLRVEEFEQRLLEENSKLRAELNAGKQTSGSFEEEAQLLKDKLREAEKAKEALQERNENMEKEGAATIEELKQQRKTLQARLEDFEADRMEKLLLEMEEQKECNILKKELAAERNAVDKCKAEIKKLRASVETLKKANTDSAVQANELNAYKEKIYRLQVALAALQRKYESAEKQMKDFQKAARKAEEAHKCQIQASQQSIHPSEEQKREIQKLQGTKSELEAAHRQKLRSMELQLQSLTTELEDKKNDLSSLQAFLSANQETTQSQDDLQAEIKELTEKTIVQGRIIQTQSKKIEILKQGKEKFYEAKRREIMKDHSDQQTLRKENSRLREKVKEVTRERKILKEQLESFANTLGSSMDSHLHGS